MKKITRSDIIYLAAGLLAIYGTATLTDQYWPALRDSVRSMYQGLSDDVLNMGATVQKESLDQEIAEGIDPAKVKGRIYRGHVNACYTKDVVTSIYDSFAQRKVGAKVGDINSLTDMLYEKGECVRFSQRIFKVVQFEPTSIQLDARHNPRKSGLVLVGLVQIEVKGLDPLYQAVLIPGQSM